MQVLIIGGTGMIGSHAALHLRSKGHAVTISGRRAAPTTVPALADLPFLAGDYLQETDFPAEVLSRFDAVVFAAGSDVRHVPHDSAADEHYLAANGEAVPAFARRARDAGVGIFVHVGSAYPHVVPDKVAESAYVRSRKMAADRTAALAGPGFAACSLDAPIVVGAVAGMVVPFFQATIQYAEGKLPVPAFAPPGGMNFISTRSLSEAIAGALENAASLSGRAVLIGDENHTYAEYLEAFFSAVGKGQKLPVLEEDHPLLPRATRYAGDAVVRYEPDAADVKLLGGYRRNDVRNAIGELVRDSKTGGSA